MSKGKEKLKPILDEKITKHLNLTVLQRIDPCVQEIIAGATHVAIYEFDIDTSEWSRKNVQGTLFVVKRNTEPHFQFLVMNRKSTENLVESLWGNFEYEVHGPYVLYRNHCKEVNGIWFYDTKECEMISNLFGRILNEYYEEPTKLKVPSRDIKVEKDDTLEPSSTAIAKVEKDDQSCVKVPSLSQSSTALVSDPPTSLPAPAPAPVTSPTVKFPVLENSEPEVSKACRTDLVKPSSFLSPRPSSSHVMPPITSFAPPPPTSPLISPGNLKRPYGTLLLPLFPPPTSPQSLTPTYAPTYMQFSREKVRKALQLLIQDNQFIEIVYRAVMNATED